MKQANGKKKTPVDDASDANGSDTSNNEKIKIQFEGLGNRLFFALKPHTKLRKVAEIFAENANVRTENIQFSLDGTSIPTDSTPGACGMVDSDCVDVIVKTDGGGFGAGLIDFQI